jgi:site-specific recombinase XerC
LPESVFSEYSTYLQAEKGIAKATRSNYLKAASDCIALIERRPQDFLLPADWGWENLDKRAIEIYLNHLRDARGWRPASIRHRASALRAFFGFLQARGHIRTNPIRALFPRAPTLASPPPEGEEAAARALFDQPAETLAQARLLALLELIYGGGLRPSLVYRIEGITVRSKEGGVRIRAGEEALQLPLSAAGVARIEAYLALRKAAVAGRRPAVFWVRGQGRPLSAAALARSVGRAMEKVGLEGGGRVLRQLSARHFRERGGDVRSLKPFLGAKRLGMLDRYGSPDFQAVSAEFRRLHPREKDESGE